jgi:hypothetical protein
MHAVPFGSEKNTWNLDGIGTLGPHIQHTCHMPISLLVKESKQISKDLLGAELT